MIKLTRESKGINNWFSQDWVTNGFFAIRRDNVLNSDDNLMELGFEERDGEELSGKLRLIPESADSIGIFDSGFKFRELTLFFGKNNELVCFESTYLKPLGVVRAEYSEATQCAKVYENGAVSMILKPVEVKGTELQKFFPTHRLLV